MSSFDWFFDKEAGKGDRKSRRGSGKAKKRRRKSYRKNRESGRAPAPVVSEVSSPKEVKSSPTPTVSEAQPKVKSSPKTPISKSMPSPVKGMSFKNKALIGTGVVGAGVAGKMVYDKYKSGQKTASVAELSALADLIEQGHFGKEAQYAFEGMFQAIDQHVEEDLTDKTASATEIDYNIYDENAARIARLNNLLRKQ